MKGIVFTELLEMVEDRFGAAVASDVLDDAALPSGGAYTAVGTYDFAELHSIVVALSARTGVPVPALLNAYGKHLFTRFVVLYPGFFTGVASAFEFLSRVDDYIHADVKKLYPDAELPHFDCRRESDSVLAMIYSSRRPLADFAAGLIEGCATYFKEDISIERKRLSTEDGSTAVAFRLERR